MACGMQDNLALLVQPSLPYFLVSRNTFNPSPCPKKEKMGVLFFFP
jgi:hypothetical protein